MTSNDHIVDLYQPAPAFGIANPSPFCLKVESWLRATATPYRIHVIHDPSRGPKGKIPWIRVAGRTVGDSELILDALTEQFGCDLDQGLTPRERADATAYRVLAEEHLYWAIVHDRWFHPKVWSLVRQQFFGHLPPGIRDLAAGLIRRRVRAQLHCAGMGRHSSNEIATFAHRDLDALAAFLGDKPFFLGESPRRVDMSLYAVLASLTEAQFDSPLCQTTRQHHSLVQYTERMRRKFFPPNT